MEGKSVQKATRGTEETAVRCYPHPKTFHNRKAWLFCQTPKGAQAGAVLYSIVRSAKANGLEPYSYLRELFETLPAISQQDTDAIEALLPRRVAERKGQTVDQEIAHTVPA